jgi:hypothetical protein
MRLGLASTLDHVVSTRVLIAENQRVEHRQCSVSGRVRASGVDRRRIALMVDQ